MAKVTGEGGRTRRGCEREELGTAVLISDTRPKCHAREGRSIIGTLGLRPSRQGNCAAYTSNTVSDVARPSRPAGARRLLFPILLLACAIASAGGTVASGAGVVTVTSPDGLNLRVSPNTTAQILAAIPLGSVLILTGDPTQDQWYPVTFGGMSGWAYGAYLTAGQVSPTAAQNAPAVAAGAPPSPPSAPAANSLSAGGPPAPPTMASLSGSAASAAPSPQAQGSGSSGAGAVLTPPIGPTALAVNTDALNVRAGPDVNSQVLGALTKGSIVQTTGASVNNWLQVSLSGMTGWMDSAYLASAATLASSTGSSAAPSNSNSTLSAALFGNPTMGTPAGPEANMTVAVAPPGSQGKFVWPVTMRRITTTFKSIHQAIDIDQYPAGGNPAVATADGIVTYAGGDACCSYGLYVIVQHKDGFSSLYAHLSKVEVTQGSLLHQGQELGLTGNTGNSTGPHIHFAIYLKGQPLDPLTVLPPGADIYPGS
jgi:murein DD-endopeptidase MepM/ murein hydrolase activator NlpD